MWIVVFLYPVVALGKRFMQGRLDPLSTMVFIGGAAMIVVNLSLNVPFLKQPWLWAGASLGTLVRVKSQEHSLRRKRAIGTLMVDKRMNANNG
jgi:hypothetical protein